MDAPTSPEVLEEYERLSPFEVRKALLAQASRHHGGAELNAGRGNPNWLATTPRRAFFALGQFAVEEAERGSGYPGAGFHVAGQGIFARFEAHARAHPDVPGMAFLVEAVRHGVDRLGFEPDAWVLELVRGALGDFYPEPNRMLPHAERVVHAYLVRTMCGGKPPDGRYDLFATEGGTAAMRYAFDSLFENRLLERGDRIALGTPTFTPYLEIPNLGEYGLQVVEIRADPRDDWQYPDAEIDRLRDPAVRAFFVVNPGNPTSRAMRPRTRERIAGIIREERPDLIVLTDDVYGTFVSGFRSLAAVVPANTLLVYSFSKHLGCTGWRLAVVALHEDNVLDRRIAGLPAAERRALRRRYGTISVDPDRLKFIDRMVADSRSVALNHTAGLSLPQQTQMALFALFILLDDGIAYVNATKAMLFARLCDLYQTLGLPVAYDPANADYYATIDLLELARRRHGASFARHLAEHVDPLELVFALAEEHSVVVLPGEGFGASEWSVRISLANLADADYVVLGERLQALIDGRHARYAAAEDDRRSTR